jgi:hypothetical protein
LDETRPLVERYNSLLKAQIDSLKHPNITFLKGIFDGLLTGSKALEFETAAAAGEGLLKGSGRKLKAEFKLDGTHLNPKYVQALLAPAVIAALA